MLYRVRTGRAPHTLHGAPLEIRKALKLGKSLLCDKHGAQTVEVTSEAGAIVYAEMTAESKGRAFIMTSPSETPEEVSRAVGSYNAAITRAERAKASDAREEVLFSFRLMDLAIHLGLSDKPRLTVKEEAFLREVSQGFAAKAEPLDAEAIRAFLRDRLNEMQLSKADRESYLDSLGGEF